MSLIYMKILEKKPETYEEEFHKLFPESKVIYNIIKNKLVTEGRVLEIGCGVGQLAIDVSKKLFNVTAVDISAEMISYATQKAIEEGTRVKFIQGDFTSPHVFEILKNQEPFDIIISTFALSEFSPLRQKLFLKQTTQLLKKGGKIYIAADNYPDTFLKRIWFSLKILIKSQLNLIKKVEITHPVRNFEAVLKEHFYVKLLFQKRNIKLFECDMRDESPIKKINIFPLEKALGRFKRLRVAWCIINGIFTRKSVLPGLYSIGKPSFESPLIITSNYYWTAWSVWHSIVKQAFDCYVLVIDSSGINVWCGAGGKHFTHFQIIDALRLFDVEKVKEEREIILPQLSATGVDQKELQKFGWKPKFGPVDINDLKSYIKAGNKDKDQSTIQFDLRFRTWMGIQHTFFILIFLFLPLSFITGFLMLLKITGGSFWFNITIQITGLGCILSMILAWIYPIFNFTDSFFIKGLIFGLGGIILVSLLLIFQNPNIELISLIFWAVLTLTVSLFITLDFSGQTPYSNHLDVESDLILFLIPGFVLSVVALLIPAFFPSISYLF